ncbi:MAG: tripartite tricarboxylate transporter substrate binding protein [Pseudorhodoferax sp.]
MTLGKSFATMRTARIDRRAFMALAGAALAGQAGGVRAQGQPLSFVVPQPAGNPTDGSARKLQPLLQAALGQAVVVENMPGAGGSIGVRKVLGTPPNTPVLLIASQTEPILTPLAMVGARYKPEELRAIGLTGRATYVLVGRPDLPAANLAELSGLARQRANQPLSFGHIGPGSMIHLLGEQWSRRMGVTLTHAPYKGVPPVVQDLMGSQIDLSFLPLAGNTPTLIESGKVRAYGITRATPLPRMPALPPLSQQDKALGDFIYGTWGAVLVPRNQPEATVQRLHAALAKALAEPELRAYTASTGTEPADPMTLAELDQFYQGEIRLYQALARELGIQPQ